MHLGVKSGYWPRFAGLAGVDRRMPEGTVSQSGLISAISLQHRRNRRLRVAAGCMAEPLERRRMLSVSMPLDVNAIPLSTVAPGALTDVNGTLYFVHSDGAHGTELWKSDGTAAGTAMVKDLRPGS